MGVDLGVINFVGVRLWGGDHVGYLYIRRGKLGLVTWVGRATVA